MTNGATMTATKPWFHLELERITQERWKVLMMPHSVQIECRHGMLVTVPFPPGLARPFLNDAREREFVGKVLLAHAKDYRLEYREGQRG